MDIDFEAMGGDPEATRDKYKRIFEKLVGNLRCIKSKTASSTWPKEFTDKLERTMVVYPTHLDQEQKDACRGGCNCMACGKAEEMNYRAVSLFGFCNEIPLDRSHEPFSCWEMLASDYSKYIDAYNQVFDDAEDNRRYRGVAHPQDGGIIIAGSTCTNRIFLFAIANNFIFNWLYIIHDWVESKRKDGIKINPNKLYYCTPEDAKRVHDSFVHLQQLSAKESPLVTKDMLSIELGYISAIKKIRARSIYTTASINVSSRAVDHGEKLGILARRPWCVRKPTLLKREAHCRPTTSSTTTAESTSAASSSSGLFEAVQTHLSAPDQEDSDAEVSSQASERSEEMAPAGPPTPAAGRGKQPIAKPRESLKRARDADEDTPEDSKRNKLIESLIKIHDKLMRSLRHEDALVVLQAIIELKK